MNLKSHFSHCEGQNENKLFSDNRNLQRIIGICYQSPVECTGVCREKEMLVGGGGISLHGFWIMRYFLEYLRIVCLLSPNICCLVPALVSIFCLPVWNGADIRFVRTHGSKYAISYKWSLKFYPVNLIEKERSLCGLQIWQICMPTTFCSALRIVECINSFFFPFCYLWEVWGGQT